MSRALILRVRETWEEFSSCCLYHTTTYECSHKDKINPVCLDRKYCPRVEATAARKKSEQPKWKSDIEEYYRLHDESFDRLTKSEAWLKEQSEKHPEIDILATMFKARNEYWRTPKGFDRRKYAKSKELDWGATYQWAIGQEWNQVKLPQSKWS